MGEIRRGDWGLTWNVALEAGGWLVSDKIKLEIDGQLAEQVEAVAAEAQLESGGIAKAVDDVMRQPAQAQEKASLNPDR